ncbi:hypothetical protein X771_20345 [Mesorhizobium sp. LSJC277A00]|nr:hypothetical protein X771_20345 [Mesorhizobium sp. LSJC277A00]
MAWPAATPRFIRLCIGKTSSVLTSADLLASMTLT